MPKGEKVTITKKVPIYIRSQKYTLKEEMGQVTQSGSLAKADVREQDERKNKVEENETESGSEYYETQAEGEATAVATENNGQEEEENLRQNNKHVIQEEVKSEVSQQRFSKRNRRKPDRLEQNLMVAKRF